MMTLACLTVERVGRISNSNHVRFEGLEYDPVRVPAVEHRIWIPPQVCWCRRGLVADMLPIACPTYHDAAVTVSGEHHA